MVENTSQGKEEVIKCQCPYCDTTLSLNSPFCKPCGKEFILCSHCKQLILSQAQTCPHCGASLS